jgi:hypothetical protein
MPKKKATYAAPQAEASPAQSVHTAQPNSDSDGAMHTTSAAYATSAPDSTSPTVPLHPVTSPVERAAVQEGHSRSADTISTNDGRPRLRPKHQKDRRVKPTILYVQPDYASKMIVEEFNDPNDPMPKGYSQFAAGSSKKHANFA